MTPPAVPAVFVGVPLSTPGGTMGTDDGTDLPKISAPARRALLGAGYGRLDQLAGVQESELLKLHGMGH
jgi:hypothetical protein